VPILPGLLPIQNYNSFKKIINLCRIRVPQELQEVLEKVKNDDEQVKECGIVNCIEMCKKLFDNNVPGVHYYTMNLEKSINEILKRMELKIAMKTRELPWKKTTNPKRVQETVRPIFWKNNYKSYLSKTWYWDEFPNGIWGDSRSPAFGNLEEHFVSFCKDYIKDNKKLGQLKKMWGETLTSYDDISKVFNNYIDGKIKKLPWCQESELQSEIVYIKDLLFNLNQSGVFTINSQPAVNGIPSSDPNLGWGPTDGYVYQKLYVEFFIDRDTLDRLVKVLNTHKSIYYQAVNRKGDVIQEGQQNTVIALTWGVFSNREIVQPTIYDSEVFLVWKDEAFDLWNEWIRIYEEDENKSPESAELLKHVQNDFYLMTVIDNDYIHPQAESILSKFVSDNKIKN
jgi:methylenetetrahydrofolate reductase (NADPH)